MKSINSSQLRSNLKEHLESLKNGERIYIEGKGIVLVGKTIEDLINDNES